MPARKIEPEATTYPIRIETALSDGLEWLLVRGNRMWRAAAGGMLGLLLAAPLTNATDDQPPATGAPATTPAAARPPIPTLEPIESDTAAPPLDGPAEMRSAQPAPLPMPRFSDEVPSRSGSTPLVLEPDDDPRDVNGSPSRRAAPAERDRDPADRMPAPRRSRLFGWLGAPPARARSSSRSNDTILVEPRSDPASDAALKRRVERQVRDAVGDRIRSVEVRVVDRNVTIRARVSRFWYRRSVRHTLETLPGLSGYRTRIEVVD
jgi:hypothetical protein